mmetsp:Transcript_8141/g.10170  ORF Transcript_8141/g.10170 Transcript_8141/m.10170 type:complete len:89 (-) Transcript_8141:1007-1273(-)
MHPTPRRYTCAPSASTASASCNTKSHKKALRERIEPFLQAGALRPLTYNLQQVQALDNDCPTNRFKEGASGGKRCRCLITEIHPCHCT